MHVGTMRPRSLSSLLALITLLVTPVFDAVADVRLVRVWPEYREAASFVRIAEYFGGKESSRELIVRSQSAERAGYYFLARFDSAHAASGSILALEYILPGEEEARVQFFPVDLPAGSRAILAGVTGGDWPGRETAPTAWRLRLLGPTGDELVRQQSFLWSLPPASAETVPASTE
ncbi:MAG: hypothetical protein EAZ36_03315 [Verrucomicrobia bacterium]|nr:MAG: hypothetical protein EAZ36_03315 [Verrucomicrobiota bacterium]